MRHPASVAEAKAETGSNWYAWLARGGLVAKGSSYGIVGVLAAEVAAGAGGEATGREGALRSLAAHPPGNASIVLLAIGFTAYAAWRLVQAVAEREDGRPDGRWLVAIARTFEDRWRTGEMSETERRWGGRAGVAGHVARFVVFGLIGVVVVVEAAVGFDPRQAIGLDGALQQLAHAAYGPYLLGLTAAGLVC